MEWISELPLKLQSSAYKAGGEYAWSRGEALEVLSWLERRRIVILGVDIWLPTTPGPSIPRIVYDWDAETALKISGAPQNASDFVRSFHWHPEDDIHRRACPYFNIVTS